MSEQEERTSMRLTDGEFRAMNSAPRRFLQRTIEFPLARRMGISPENCDVLEIGCGSGYSAVLMSALSPRSYVGIDLMPEQIAIARKRRLANAEFMVLDATNLGCFSEATKDVVVIFGVLHHIPQWRTVIGECHRVLRPRGKLFIEEPDACLMGVVRRLFPGSHPKEASFRLQDLEAHLRTTGFAIVDRRWVFGFGFYCAHKVVAKEQGAGVSA